MASIFDVLRSIGELEQTGGDYGEPTPERLTFAPVVVFRHRERTQELAERLAGWIAGFRGEYEWRLQYSLSGPGINWVLAPRKLWDVAAQRGLRGVKAAQVVLQQEDPEFGRRANAELERLAAHLASLWRSYNNVGES